MSRRHRPPRTRPLERVVRRLIASSEGATAIEYALLVGMLAAVIVGALGGLGDAIRDLPLPALLDAFASALS